MKKRSSRDELAHTKKEPHEMSSDEFGALMLHSREALQIWLASDFERREELHALLGQELGTELESLNVLEAFLLSRYRSPEEILKLGEREVLDAAARHVGLVMLLNLDDAEWDIDVEDADHVYARLPLIRVHGADECPLSMVTASLDRRTGTFLRQVVEAYQ